MQAIPKLKLLGTFEFTGLFFQLVSLSNTWFTLNNSKFSIKGISSTYTIDMMGKDCNTIETIQGFFCYCDSNCEHLSTIHTNGWICIVLILISANFFIAEILSIRRKIWRCEGHILQGNFLDNDFFMVFGTFVLNLAFLFWFWSIFTIQENVKEIFLGGGVNMMIISIVLHVWARFYYFFKVRAETMPR